MYISLALCSIAIEKKKNFVEYSLNRFPDESECFCMFSLFPLRYSLTGPRCTLLHQH